MGRNKIGSLFLISVLALAGIGISYAGWTDSITVSGTVQTGHVGFDVTSFSGTEVWKVYGSDKPTNERYVRYWPGMTTVDLAYPASYADGKTMLVGHSEAYGSLGQVNTVNFVFTNLFPCVDFKADFKFTIGTIPVLLTGTNLAWTNQKINNQAATWIPTISGHDAPTVTVTITDQAGNQVYPGTPGALIQLHPDVTYTWTLLIHIPQDNAYMNCYADGSCTLNIVQWSDQCNPPTTGGKTLFLPPSSATVDTLLYANPGVVGYGPNPTTPNTYFDLLITGIPAGYAISDGIKPAWCADSNIFIYWSTHYPTHLWDSRDPLLPSYAQDDEHWDKVNYILNYWNVAAPSATWSEIQAAIWFFTDASPNYEGYFTANSQAIVNAANLNGALFVPGVGQWLAIVVDMGPNVQLSFIVVDP